MSLALADVRLTGTGAWPSGRLDGSGPADPVGTDVPPASLLTARLRRRASLVTRICAEVLEQCGAAGQPRIVLASAWGEIGITVSLLEAICRDEPLSPTAFHNSVHNAAMGYVSIATDNRAASVALAAGDAGVAMGALEAVTTVLDEDRPCVFIAAEEAVPAPFEPSEPTSPVGLAWRLEPWSAATASARGQAPQSRLRLEPDGGSGLDDVGDAGHHADRGAPLPAPLRSMAALIDAHRRRAAVRMPLGAGWRVTLEPLP